MLCRWLMALRFLVCLEKHALEGFLDIGCDHWEILLTYFSISFFSFVVFVFPLTFKEHVPSSSRIVQTTETQTLT